MKPIRASEIGSYLYCRRAWWYKLHGFQSENQADMSAGTDLHRRHGRKVFVAGILRTIALLIFLAAMTLLVAYCTARIV